MKRSVDKALLSSYSYSEYKKIISDLLIEGKSTGKEQSEDLLQYSVLNEIRLKRLDKTICIPEEISSQLKSCEKEYIWLVVAEGWCGDAAQILPILNKMSLESDKIDLRIVLRDANDELMSHFLTNGARAIPKLIIVDKESGEVCDHWGPRPQGASDLIKDYKEEFSIVDQEAKRQLQLWYLRDRGLSVQNEVAKKMCLECLCS
ncbi:thioredoxin family protein [Flavobacterium aquicola]|uniref:Thioredoxin-like protein n=1 Tax=Flavobacterium aquicola TaxID=1682742 RepID=A0A3E0DXG3_9FLAO|nr:thioredoxin family protein [Flavobacterium aquicola]REG90752.1 thioredoxin-like protein [Flavobacterium aquicola]